MTGATKQSGSVWTLAVLSAAALTEYFEINMVYVTLPALYRSFGDPVAVGWVVTVFGLVGAASVAVGGRIGDVVGYRRVLLYALAASAVGSFVSASAQDLWQLVLGRGIQGTAAVILPVAIGHMRTVIRDEGRQKFHTGLIAGVAFSAAGIAPLVGGLLLADFGWHAVFVVSGVLSVIVFLATLTLRSTHTRTGSLREVDIVGGIAMMPGIVLVLIGITQLRTWGVASPLTWFCIVGGIAVLVAWYAYERRQANPVIDFTLFRSRAFTLSCVVFVIFAVGSLATASTQSVVAQGPVAAGGFGISAPVFGLIAAIGAIAAGTLMNVVAGWVAMRWDASTALIIGTVVSATAYLVFLWILLGTELRGVAPFAVFTIISSAGIAMMNTALPSFVPEAVPTDRTGVALGVQQVVKQGAQSIGLQIAAILMAVFPLVSAVPGGPATYPSQSAIGLVYAYSAVLTLAIIPIALYGRRMSARLRAADRRPAASAVVSADG